MTGKQICGLDFGTSNSTLGLLQDGLPQLAALEDTHVTLPSALFFDFEESSTHFGRDAINSYMEAGEGRLMRALKSILGSPTIEERTLIGSELKPFSAILGLFLKHMKQKAEANTGEELTHVVMGRPVFFVDRDQEADRQAQRTLEQIARDVGFSQVEFEFEPVAAARDFQSNADKEELALIVDIGGGTSDFTILRVTPGARSMQHSRDAILANAGIHIGGTDFDRWLSLAKVMPLLGYLSPMLKEGRQMPVGFYHDLATWQKINFLYDHKTRTDLRYLAKEAKHPELIERLIHLLDLREGHRLALTVEDAKIDLSDSPETSVNLAYIEKGLETTILQQELADTLEVGNQRIANTICEALTQANVSADDITALFMTGGSTRVPIVREALIGMMPKARVIDGDAFGSVGAGLALAAHDCFG